MASSDNKRKEATSTRHRSHRGCWTCKKKRIQCDEARPGCQKCISRGLACEGYEIRLRWGAGIASRGRYNGAEKPVKEFIPPPSRRRWDLRSKAERKEACDQQGQPALLLASSFTPDQSFSHPVSPRATVNILNAPYGQDAQDYMDITKHFELPVSTREEFEQENPMLFDGGQRMATAQYGERSMQRRSVMIA